MNFCGTQSVYKVWVLVVGYAYSFKPSTQIIALDYSNSIS
jgi:hypothetical protein